MITFLCVALLSIISLALPAIASNATLAERQTGCLGSSPCAELDGDGNPNQWICHKQLSQWVENGGLGNYQEQSYTLTSNFGNTPFIDGGFDVVQSLDTGIGDATSCGGAVGHRVCIKAVIWFTDFTVKHGTKTSCSGGCDTSGDPQIVRVPNALHDGYVEYACAWDDDCGDQGSEMWFPGPPGGPPSPPSLEKRQSCFPAGSCTKVEGNGDPHRWILHKQLSARKDCGDTYCVVGDTDQIDYKISANTHSIDWISGGFEVAESVQTGKHLDPIGCTGGGQNPGNDVCTKAVIWHTDYTVRGGIANQCDMDGCQEYDYTTIIRSPNAITGNVEYYCAYDDDCGEQGDEFWIFGGAGGPP